MKKDFYKRHQAKLKLAKSMEESDCGFIALVLANDNKIDAHIYLNGNEDIEMLSAMESVARRLLEQRANSDCDCIDCERCRIQFRAIEAAENSILKMLSVNPKSKRDIN